jgi:hypothetical protein
MPAIFTRVRSDKGRQIGLRLAVAGFLIRALVPVGFMPAPLAAGGPIVICHGGLAGAFFQGLAEPARDTAMPAHAADRSAMMHLAHSDHSSATDEPALDHSAWDHCPTGVSASAAPLAQSFSFSLLVLSDRPANPESHFGIPVPPIGSYQARAPPPNLARLLA